ncbi:testicular haploid expressed gene protein-like [Cygnus olor]|uniref:testicular haploid expressed gene protein-like n=1 Tax=Cygnus olor TaxID=8869 RepID=UPI001ADE3E11|nr:testicular haploid expressed gene protein-like [Cygnus olor]
MSKGTKDTVNNTNNCRVIVRRCANLAASSLFHTEEQAARAADVTKCLNSLLVFQVSCHLSTHSHDRQDTRTRRTQESALCKQSQQPTCTALGNSVLKKACVGKPRNNPDPLKGSCNSSAIPKNSGTSQTQARLWQAPWQVSKFALQAIASPRTLELARAKRLNPDYVPPRDAQWPVTKAAKQAVATPRLVELAQPRKR